MNSALIHYYRSIEFTDFFVSHVSGNLAKFSSPRTVWIVSCGTWIADKGVLNADFIGQEFFMAPDFMQRT